MMIKLSYCSIIVDNYGGTWLIRFVSKNYAHPWKFFANKLRLVLHACICLFVKKKIMKTSKHGPCCDRGAVGVCLVAAAMFRSQLLVWMHAWYVWHPAAFVQRVEIHLLCQRVTLNRDHNSIGVLLAFCSNWDDSDPKRWWFSANWNCHKADLPVKWDLRLCRRGSWVLNFSIY